MEFRGRYKKKNSEGNAVSLSPCRFMQYSTTIIAFFGPRGPIKSVAACELLKSALVDSMTMSL